MGNTTMRAQHLGVGIDTARYGHRVTFLREDRQPAATSLTVTENQQGYRRLRDRLEELHRKHPQAQFHVHVDAAGQYAANLERFLRSLPLPLSVSIGEPKRNQDYRKAFFPKRTSDDTESQAMARFGVVEQPPVTPEVPAEFQLVREIASRLESQVKDSTRAVNRLHNVLARVFPELATIVSHLAAAWVLTMLRKHPTPARIATARLGALKKIPYLRPQLAEAIHAAAQNSVASLQGPLAESLVLQQVEQLQLSLASEEKLQALLVQAYRGLPVGGHVHLASIPGIGEVTAAVLTAKIVSIDRFATADKLVGYFGVFPEENTSGVDRWGRPIPPGTMQMSRKGTDLVRRYLWNAAKSACQHNPAVRDLFARLRGKGTRGDVALGHCMRKLLHQVFAVWTSNRPYDERLAQMRRTGPTSPTATPPEAETKTAAGRTRAVGPQTPAVTAADSNVGPPGEAVKPPRPRRGNRAGSIDYAYLRQQVTLEQVLRHLGHLDQLRGRGTQRRGPCPLHPSEAKQGRTFSVDLAQNIFQCFQPGCCRGNVLDFWQAKHKLPLHEAALHLARTFDLRTQRE